MKVTQTILVGTADVNHGEPALRKVHEAVDTVGSGLLHLTWEGKSGEPEAHWPDYDRQTETYVVMDGPTNTVTDAMVGGTLDTRDHIYDFADGAVESVVTVLEPEEAEKGTAPVTFTAETEAPDGGVRFTVLCGNAKVATLHIRKLSEDAVKELRAH